MQLHPRCEPTFTYEGSKNAQFIWACIHSTLKCTGMAIPYALLLNAAYLTMMHYLAVILFLLLTDHVPIAHCQQ